MININNKSESFKKNGFILINKPVGPTSHDVIDKLRKITVLRKIGHAGTLDPFASGLLIVAIGRSATRELKDFVKLDKEYSAALCLGASTDTYDRTGRILNQCSGDFILEIAAIKKILKQFVGGQKQIPPMYSAKKIKGKKLYELARAGIEVKREPAVITIYSIKIIKYQWPDLEIKVKCSSGTYIRALANDIGERLGCGAYLKALERTAIGQYKIEQAIALADIKPANWEKYLFNTLIAKI